MFIQLRYKRIKPDRLSVPGAIGLLVLLAVFFPGQGYSSNAAPASSVSQHQPGQQWKPYKIKQLRKARPFRHKPESALVSFAKLGLAGLAFVADFILEISLLSLILNYVFSFIPVLLLFLIGMGIIGYGNYLLLRWLFPESPKSASVFTIAIVFILTSLLMLPFFGPS